MDLCLATGPWNKPHLIRYECDAFRPSCVTVLFEFQIRMCACFLAARLQFVFVLSVCYGIVLRIVWLVHPSRHLLLHYQQQSQKRCPKFPEPSHLLQLIQGGSKQSPGQQRDVVPPASPGSFPAPPAGGTYPETDAEASLTDSLDAEEQRLYSELLLCNQAPHPAPKGAPGNPTEEMHFRRLYLQSCYFSQYPKLMTVGEGGKVDRSIKILELLQTKTGSLHRPARDQPPFSGRQKGALN